MTRNEIPADLEQLARSANKWPGGLKSGDVLQDGSGAYFYVSEEVGDWTESDWLQARQLLGLESPEATEAEDEAWEAMEEKQSDMVNHPPHYQLHEGYEVYDLRQDLAVKAMAANVPHDQFSDWDRALEYLLRMWDKNGVEDAKKGAWYVNKLIGKLEKDNDR